MPSDLCREFERHSRQMPDLDELLACPELSRHAAGCETCARQLRDTRHLQVALPRWQAEVPAVDLTDAVVARWQDELPAVATAVPAITRSVRPEAAPALRTPVTVQAGPHAAPGGSRAGVLVTAVLALLLSALVIAPGRQVPGNSTPANPPLASAVADAGTPAARAGSTASPGFLTPPAASAPREVPIDRLVWNAGSAWTGLTTAAVGEVTASALSAAGSPPDLRRQPDASPLSLLDETIGPMQQDLTEAVYFLMDVLPTGNGSRT